MIITPLASPTRALIKLYHWLLAHSLPRPTTHGYTVHSRRAAAPPSWSTSALSAPGTRGPSLNQCWEDARRKKPGSCCPWSLIRATVCVAPNSGSFQLCPSPVERAGRELQRPSASFRQPGKPCHRAPGQGTGEAEGKLCESRFQLLPLPSPEAQLRHPWGRPREAEMGRGLQRRGVPEGVGHS